VRLQDLQFVLNELERWNAQHGGPFASHLDLSRIAVAGHALGGLTAYVAVQLDARFKAGIVLDGPVPEAAVGATKTPVLLLAAGRKQWDANARRLWSNLHGPRLAVNLEDSEQVALSDWIWLARDAIETGPMGPEKTIAAVREYIAAFLDTYLRGEAINPLLTRPSPDYPDAAVT
jgi:pimeloyl-ACP methyl ester carboxylesterase